MTDENVWKDDLFNRKEYASFLTNILVNHQKCLVINLNSEWGTGKTFFLEKWHKDIRQTHLSVFYNAWKNDYTKDPLLSVTSSVLSELYQLLPPEEKESRSFLRLAKNGFCLAGKLAPSLAREAAKKYIGEEEASEIFGSLFEDEHKLLGELAEKSSIEIINSIKNYKKTENNIFKFREELSLTIKKIANATGRKQLLFLFIDELDRCRPLFAIELLENIKHLFEVLEIRFIIATDTEQLSHSISAIYGSRFNARKYLRRFFDRQYRFPDPDYIEYSINLLRDFNFPSNLSIPHVGQDGLPSNETDARIIECIKIPSGISEVKNVNYIIIFAMLSKYFNLDLRTQEQCYEEFEATTCNLNSSKIYDALYILFLIIFRAQHPAEFEKYDKCKNSSDRCSIVTNTLGETIINVSIDNVITSVYNLLIEYTRLSVLPKREVQRTHANEGTLRSAIFNRLGSNILEFQKYGEVISISHDIDKNIHCR